eukprot:365864-Chlamydomonas_euryale.AAC.2
MRGTVNAYWAAKTASFMQGTVCAGQQRQQRLQSNQRMDACIIHARHAMSHMRPCALTAAPATHAPMRADSCARHPWTHVR